MLIALHACPVVLCAPCTSRSHTSAANRLIPKYWLKCTILWPEKCLLAAQHSRQELLCFSTALFLYLGLVTQDILAAPASQAYVECFRSVAGLLLAADTE